MPDTTVTILISALIGAVVSYLGALLKNFMDIRSKVDESLRESRIPVYKELWVQTSLLPKRPRSEKVTYEVLARFSVDLTDWYFNQGGIFMSKRAFAAYGDLQNTIHRVLPKDRVLPKGGEGRVSDLHYDEVRGMCSKLRTELTNDLLSRRGAPFSF
jgi:hypothetical protein